MFWPAFKECIVQSVSYIFFAQAVDIMNIIRLLSFVSSLAFTGAQRGYHSIHSSPVIHFHLLLQSSVSNVSCLVSCGSSLLGRCNLHCYLIVFLFVLYCTNCSCAGHHGCRTKWDAASVQRLQRWGLLLTGFKFFGGGERSCLGQILPKKSYSCTYLGLSLAGWSPWP